MLAAEPTMRGKMTTVVGKDDLFRVSISVQGHPRIQAIPVTPPPGVACLALRNCPTWPVIQSNL